MDPYSCRHISRRPALIALCLLTDRPSIQSLIIHKRRSPIDHRAFEGFLE